MNYLLGTLIATIGVLLVMLNLKGSKLHVAQLALISLQMRTVNEEDAKAVALVRTKYLESMADYARAKHEK